MQPMKRIWSMYEKKTHAKFVLPAPDVHAKHPLRDIVNHNKLLEYLKERLAEGAEHRDMRLPRMAHIDKKVAGWIHKTDEELEAQAQADKNNSPNPTDVNLPLSFVHLDDMMTYFAQTFAPNRGMFYELGKPDEAAASNQIVTLMNNHAIHAGYYREILLTIFGLLKYNLGGLIVEWSQDIGPQLNPANPSQLGEPTTVWQGNRVTSANMYNTFYDPLVHPTKLHTDGEYCATVELKSRYWIQQQALNGELTNLTAALEEGRAETTCKYYRHPPSEASLSSDPQGQTASGIDWVKELSGWGGYQMSGGFELVTMWARLNPTEWNLIEGTKEELKARSRYEIWEFKILGDEWIVSTKPMTNMHNFLPLFLALANDDQMELSQRSVGEILVPLQDFSSHLLNVHMRANRKNLWGITYYDSTAINYGAVKKGSVSMRVPVAPQMAGKKISDLIYHDSQQIDTSRTMSDLDGVMGLINQFFPTSIAPSQIGDIDRAVNSQVAAVQQGSNRRNHKTARLLDSTLLRPMRSAMYYNIIQFQPDGQMVSDFYGRPVRVDLTQLRQTDLPYIIGQGLMMLDRQASAAALQSVIVMLIQNPIAAQQLGVGIITLLNYWVSLLDLDIDLTQMIAQNQPAAPAQAPAPDPTQEVPLA